MPLRLALPAGLQPVWGPAALSATSPVQVWQRSHLATAPASAAAVHPWTLDPHTPHLTAADPSNLPSELEPEAETGLAQTAQSQLHQA